MGREMMLALVVLGMVGRAVADAPEVSRVPVKPESLTTTIAGGSSSLSAATREQILRVEDLRADLSVLHLMNGLHLMVEKMQTLLARCREAKALRDATVAAMMPHLRNAESGFAALKRDLLRDEVREKALDDAEQANEALKTLKDGFDRRMSELEGRTSQIFSEAQREVVRQFRPCVVPTKEERNPERVGQAMEPAGFVKVLEHLRTVPAEHLGAAKQRGYEMQVLRWEKHFGTMTDKEKAEVRKQLDAAVAQARAMSETKFEMSKAELAQSVVMPRRRRRGLASTSQARPPTCFWTSA